MSSLNYDHVAVNTKIIRRAKNLLEKECARRRKMTGGRVSEGVIIGEAVLAYFGEAEPDSTKRPTNAVGKNRAAA